MDTHRTTVCGLRSGNSSRSRSISSNRERGGARMPPSVACRPAWPVLRFSLGSPGPEPAEPSLRHFRAVSVANPKRSSNGCWVAFRRLGHCPVAAPSPPWPGSGSHDVARSVDAPCLTAATTASGPPLLSATRETDPGVLLICRYHRLLLWDTTLVSTPRRSAARNPTAHSPRSRCRDRPASPEAPP
jgi:hypothetical protein